MCLRAGPKLLKVYGWPSVQLWSLVHLLWTWRASLVESEERMTQLLRSKVPFLLLQFLILYLSICGAMTLAVNKMRTNSFWKTIFQVMMRLFSPRKTTLLFVIRDKTRTPLETWEPIPREDIQKVSSLRQRFYNSIALGGLARDQCGVVPASGFSYSSQQIWSVIKENKDVDLPANKVMAATVRCEEIANEKFAYLSANENWIELEEAAQTKFVPG